VRDMVAISPMDSGWYEIYCNPKRSPDMNSSHHEHQPDIHVNCAAWDDIVATYDYLDHIILPGFDFWNTSADHDSSRVQQAVKFFERSAFAGNYSNLPHIELKDAGQYYEANLLGNPHFPEGVKFLIGNFPELFGTKEADKLQALCNHYSWPLVWALGSAAPQSGFDFFSNKTIAGNQRLLDPAVKANAELNVTLPEDANATFWRLSKEAAQVRQHSQYGPSREQFEHWWAELMPHQIRMAPLTAHACGSGTGIGLDTCVGTDVGTGECICKTTDVSAGQFIV